MASGRVPNTLNTLKRSICSFPYCLSNSSKVFKMSVTLADHVFAFASASNSAQSAALFLYSISCSAFLIKSSASLYENHALKTGFLISPLFFY